MKPKWALIFLSTACTEMFCINPDGDKRLFKAKYVDLLGYLVLMIMETILCAQCFNCNEKKLHIIIFALILPRLTDHSAF